MFLFASPKAAKITMAVPVGLSFNFSAMFTVTKVFCDPLSSSMLAATGKFLDETGATAVYKRLRLVAQLTITSTIR